MWYNLKMHYLKVSVYVAIFQHALKLAWKESKEYREAYRTDVLDLESRR
jgi:hypothetical protein